MKKQKHVAHVVGCSCDECTFPESGCPYCKWEEVTGQYACLPPYEWFWEVGLGDQPANCKYCGNCGNLLPTDHGLNPCAECKTHQPKYRVVWKASETSIHKTSASC